MGALPWATHGSHGGQEAKRARQAKLGPGGDHWGGTVATEVELATWQEVPISPNGAGSRLWSKTRRASSGAAPPVPRDTLLTRWVFKTRRLDLPVSRPLLLHRRFQRPSLTCASSLLTPSRHPPLNFIFLS